MEPTHKKHKPEGQSQCGVRESLMTHSSEMLWQSVHARVDLHTSTLGVIFSSQFLANLACCKSAYPDGAPSATLRAPYTVIEIFSFRSIFRSIAMNVSKKSALKVLSEPTPGKPISKTAVFF